MNNDNIGKNQSSLNTLVRIVNTLSDNFSLILACCNYRNLREKAMRIVRKKCLVNLQEITLDTESKTLYTNIKNCLGESDPSALMIFGLESVNNIEEVLQATNQIREEFSNFQFPLILWIDDRLLQMMIRLTPDFYSWATTVEFIISKNEVLKFIRQTTDDVFQTISDSGASIFLKDSTFQLEPGSPLRNELELAQKDIKKRNIELDTELAASLEFVLGRIADNSTETARHHYEKSLTLWEKTENRERWGYILFYIGFWWHSYGFIHHLEREESYLKAKDYYQQSFQKFEEDHRKDLVSKFINALGLVLYQLQQWDELDDLAKKAVILHKKAYPHPFRQARVYHLISEVALAKRKWKKAKKLAEKALNIFAKEIQERYTLILHEEVTYLTWEKSFHKAGYLFSLAKAHNSLGEIEAGIRTLNEALEIAKPEYDPELYIDILNELQRLYFQDCQYFEAFQTKQKRREIQQQFGLRAFIGAGRLVQNQSIKNPGVPYIDKHPKINPEIAASGRVKDIEKLIRRIRLNDRKLIVIHGYSGVGKSSIIQAGLIPEVRNLIVEERRVLPVIQRYYTDWVQRLSQALTEAFSHLNSVPIHIGEISSLEDIKTVLRQNIKHNFLIVLIFDQFEELFFVCTEPAQRKKFYDFLKFCLDTPFVKVILSLRQDYLHYLLEGNRLKYFEAVNHNILDRSILYHVGNFSPDEAKSVIQKLTETTQVIPEAALIDELVQDLAQTSNEVRPIELQVVGAQLQTMGITTLEQYRQEGPTRRLVEKYLEEVIAECGTENRQLAELVLYLLTDENNTRPLKTRSDLIRELRVFVRYLDHTNKDLDTVLQIFVASGIVCLLPEIPVQRYQLVHDYLVSFIRQQRSEEIISQLEQAEEQNKMLLQEKLETEEKLNEVLQQKLKAEQQRLEVEEQNKILLQQKYEEATDKNKKRKTQLIFSLGLSMLMAALTTTSSVLWQSSQRQKQELDLAKLTLNYSMLMNENNQLEAFLTILEAGKKLRNITPNTEFEKKTFRQLQASVNIIQERNRLEKHIASVLTVSVSRNNEFIASGGDDGTIIIWNKDGKLLSSSENLLEAHNGNVWCVTFDPESQTIASAGEDKTIKLWSVKEGRLQFIRTIGTHDDEVKWVSFSPDGQQIASASKDKMVKLWSRDGQLIQTLEGHKNTVLSVSFSLDGQRIASASEDNTIKLWNREGKLIQTLEDHTAAVWSVAFSPDSQKLVSASDDKTIKIWNREGELQTSLEGHQKGVNTVSFSEDGEYIASASSDQTIKLWSRDGIIISTIEGHRDTVNQVSLFSTSQIQLASASKDGTIRLWSLPVLPTVYQPSDYRISRVSFSPNSAIVASPSRDLVTEKPAVVLWDSQTRTRVKTFLSSGDRVVYRVSFSPNGKKIASTSDDQTVRIWSIYGEDFKTLIHQNKVSAISFSRNGQLIATAGEQTLNLWTREGELLWSRDRNNSGHNDSINDISFSPDGQIIASAGSDGQVTLWSLQGSVVNRLKADRLFSISFSPDNEFMAGAAVKGKVYLWKKEGDSWISDNITQKILSGHRDTQILSGHRDTVYQVSFSPDSQLLASASKDGTIKLWDRNGFLVTTLKQGSEPVQSVDFSWDSKTLVSVHQNSESSQPNRVSIWKLDFQRIEGINDLVELACQQLDGYLDNNPNVKPEDKKLCSE
ncbi:MAG: sugar-binding protein [Cyanobacteria bacterium J06592_8]